jgi:hypothetical protein
VEQASGLLAGLEKASVLNNNTYYNGDKSNKEALIYRLANRIDDSFLFGLGGDNYTRFARLLTQLMTACSTYDAQADKLLDESFLAQRFISWDKSYSGILWDIPAIGTNRYRVDFSANGSLTLTHSFVVDLLIDDSGSGGVMPTYELSNPLPLSAFEPVVFLNNSDLPTLTDAGSAKGSLIIVPAIFLKFASDKQWNSQVLNGLAITVDLATLATGPGAWVKAAQLASKARQARRAWTLFDVSNAAGNLAINVARVDDPGFMQLVELHNLMMVGIGLKDVSRMSLEQSVRAMQAAQGIDWAKAAHYVHLWQQLQKNAQLLNRIPAATQQKIRTLSQTLRKEYKLRYGKEVYINTEFYRTKAEYR